jgi:hypothetical protein
MTRLVALTALATGVLLLLVPRFILPTCEYEGYPRMHCSDTARAEYVVGAILAAVGCAAFFAKTIKLPLLGAITAFVLYGVAFLLPDITGYCRSPRMPCTYGTVPAVRVIAVTGAVTMIVAVAGLANLFRRKGNA